MPKSSHRLFIGVLCGGMIVLFGCTTGNKALKVKSYFVEKERVDQDMSGGNYGYIYGTPKPPDRSHLPKTRKIFVVELTREEDIPEEPIVIEDVPDVDTRVRVPEHAPSTAAQPPAQEVVTLPVYEAVVEEPAVDRSAAETAYEYVEYTVEKNDTLQKISKKFYGRYSRWPRIYEANKDRMKDPNFLKPGMVLRIPLDKKAETSGAAMENLK